VLDRWIQKAPKARTATGQLTPDQAAYKQSITPQSQWLADPMVGTWATATRMHRHADGTGDMIRLDQDGTHWFHGDASAGAHVKVGRI